MGADRRTRRGQPGVANRPTTGLLSARKDPGRRGTSEFPVPTTAPDATATTTTSAAADTDRVDPLKRRRAGDSFAIGVGDCPKVAVDDDRPWPSTQGKVVGPDAPDYFNWGARTKGAHGDLLSPDVVVHGRRQCTPR